MRTGLDERAAGMADHLMFMVQRRHALDAVFRLSDYFCSTASEEWYTSAFRQTIGDMRTPPELPDNVDDAFVAIIASNYEPDLTIDLAEEGEEVPVADETLNEASSHAHDVQPVRAKAVLAGAGKAIKGLFKLVLMAVRHPIRTVVLIVLAGPASDVLVGTVMSFVGATQIVVALVVGVLLWTFLRSPVAEVASGA